MDRSEYQYGSGLAYAGENFIQRAVADVKDSDANAQGVDGLLRGKIEKVSEALGVLKKDPTKGKRKIQDTDANVQYKRIDEAQTKAGKNKQSIQDDDSEWEGSCKMLKQNIIQSTETSRQNQNNQNRNTSSGEIDD